MNGGYLQRRSFLLGGFGLGATVPALLPIARAEPVANPLHGLASLEDFVRQYMQAMNAPGLTLALADEKGTVGTTGFGYSDLEAKQPVTPELLFEIGSISKSFVAITILQLHEQGKVDLQRPILDYLPWLPIEAGYGPITIHHLLTHTSGLPDALALFQTDPNARLVQRSRPGERFHYCNAGFDTLGLLVEKLDGRNFSQVLEARIFKPLGMASSLGSITNRTLTRRAKSYVPLFDDLTYFRQGKLATAPNLVFSNAAGCITSTPGDMARYMQMLVRRGVTPTGRLLSEESFALFSKPYIKAEEFSPTAYYGYGIAVDHLDGHKILRHTGGMISFASAMHVDLDGKVAAFASINAMQGYRPNPVTECAIQQLRARREKKPIPSPPKLTDPQVVKNAKEYAGVYTSLTGKSAKVTADGDRLRIEIGPLESKLEAVGDGVFIAVNLALARFPFVFGRAEMPKNASEEQKKSAPVVELTHGSDWYINSQYSGAKEFPQGQELAGFTGYYRGESPWIGTVRVVAVKGNLWLDGATVLEALGKNLFRIGSDPSGPETAEFFYLADGKARLLKLSGGDLWRVDAE